MGVLKKIFGGGSAMKSEDTPEAASATLEVTPAESPNPKPSPEDRPAPAPSAPPREPDTHEMLQTPRPGEPEGLRSSIIDTLRTVFDPEIPVNIYELGLIYNIDIDPDGAVQIRITLTAPNCPVAGTLPGEVETKVRGVKGVTAAKLELVWEPAWSMARMSEAARLELGF